MGGIVQIGMFYPEFIHAHTYSVS